MENPKSKPASDEYSIIKDICNTMDPREVIFSIVRECPYDPKHKSCPIKEIEGLRSMELGEAYLTINNLSPDILRELVEKHCHCSCLLSSKSKKE